MGPPVLSDLKKFARPKEPIAFLRLEKFRWGSGLARHAAAQDRHSGGIRWHQRNARAGPNGFRTGPSAATVAALFYQSAAP